MTHQSMNVFISKEIIQNHSQWRESNIRVEELTTADSASLPPTIFTTMSIL